jgi:hypothetical protein
MQTGGLAPWWADGGLTRPDAPVRVGEVGGVPAPPAARLVRQPGATEIIWTLDADVQELELEVRDGCLVLRGRSAAGPFSRAVEVPKDLDPAARRMRFTAGEVRVIVPVRHHGWSGWFGGWVRSFIAWFRGRS